MPKKKVVYLFGAGATQAEIQFVGDSLKLLTNELSNGMIERIVKKKIKPLYPLRNELAESDVEHLITLYAAVGTPKYDLIAVRLKELFREEILDKLKAFEKRHFGFEPTLMPALVDMHSIPELNEELTALITLNYDDMLEKSLQNVTGGVNYVVGAKNSRSGLRIRKGVGVPLLKLHGSFNWRKGYPLQVSDQNSIEKEEEVLWIPPGVLKNKEQYPFNSLWELAKDLLQCHVLRVVGCSLNRNDWQLLSLLFAMQKINNSRKFSIEIIAFHETGKAISRNYPYLKVTTILDITEFRRYLFELYGMADTGDLPPQILDAVSETNSRSNVFESWLRAKGNQLKSANLESLKGSKYFQDFINQT